MEKRSLEKRKSITETTKKKLIDGDGVGGALGGDGYRHSG